MPLKKYTSDENPSVRRNISGRLAKHTFGAPCIRRPPCGGKREHRSPPFPTRPGPIRADARNLRWQSFGCGVAEPRGERALPPNSRTEPRRHVPAPAGPLILEGPPPPRRDPRPGHPCQRPAWMGAVDAACALHLGAVSAGTCDPGDPHRVPSSEYSLISSPNSVRAPLVLPQRLRGGAGNSRAGGLNGRIGVGS